MMNYNKLRYFYEIAKTQNLTHASKLLFVSQSSLSKAIADLEKDFGTELFVRTNKNLVLTDAGRELQRQVEQMFANEGEIYRAVQNASKKKEGGISARLRIGFMAAQENLLLPDFVKGFVMRYPNVDVQLARYNKVELLKHLAKKTLDMVLVIYSKEEITPEYQYMDLGEHRLSVIARDDHPLAGKELATLHEFEADSFLMHGHFGSPNEYENAIIWCRRSGFMPHIIGEYDYVETVLTLVDAGMGISLLSDAAPYEHWKHLVNIPLENAPVIYDGFFWRKNNDFSEEMDTALSLFRNGYMEYIGRTKK